jgi:hypothetical protein
LVGASNGDACGRYFPPWGRCREVPTPFSPSCWVNTQIRLAGFDYDNIVGRHDLLRGMFFKVLGATLDGPGLLVGSSSSGSINARVPLACFLWPAPVP